MMVVVLVQGSEHRGTHPPPAPHAPQRSTPSLVQQDFSRLHRARGSAPGTAADGLSCSTTAAAPAAASGRRGNLWPAPTRWLLPPPRPSDEVNHQEVDACLSARGPKPGWAAGESASSPGESDQAVQVSQPGSTGESASNTGESNRSTGQSTSSTGESTSSTEMGVNQQPHAAVPW